MGAVITLRLFTFIYCLTIIQWAQASDLAATILQMQAEIKNTTDAKKRARMQKSFEKRMTPRFEQQMRNAQNNLYRSITRLEKNIKSGQQAFAHTEIKTFERHLNRFEKLSKAGNALPKYADAKFDFKLERVGRGTAKPYSLRATPSMSSQHPKGIHFATNVRAFLSKFGFLEKRRADNTRVKIPSNNATRGGRPGAPLKPADLMNPGGSTP